MPLTNYIVIYDGVVQGGAGPGPSPAEIEIQDDGVKVGDASTLDFVRTGVKASVTVGVATIDFPKVIDYVVEVSPGFDSDDDFNQYPTIAQGLTRADTLVAGGASGVMVYVRPGTYVPTGLLTVNNKVGLVLSQKVDFDFSSWTGAIFLRLSGNSFLIGGNFIWGLFGVHPITTFIEVAAASQAGIEKTWVWDIQGGSPRALDIKDGGSIVGGLNVFSIISTAPCIDATGTASLTLENSRASCLFGDVIKGNDNLTPAGPSLTVKNSVLDEVGGGGMAINRSANTSTTLKGTYFDISTTNLTLTDVQKMLNANEMFQDIVPHHSDPSPDKYMLSRGLEELRYRIEDNIAGHNHAGGPDQGASVDYINVLSTPNLSRDIAFGALGNYWVQATGQTYTIVGRFIFPGTSIDGTPSAIKALLAESGTGLGSARIYDLTNAQVICEITNISGITVAIYDMGVLSNLPTGEAVFEVQVLHADVAGIVYCSALQIRF